jgi:alcohol dehydrogenase
MQAIVIDAGGLRRVELPLPRLEPGWALIQPRLVGICRTDLELMAGYRHFAGVPGHEFVGIIAACDSSERVGQRVVGDINVGCGRCPRCRSGGAHHCAGRRVLGIERLNGCMAEAFVLPLANLVPVPSGVSELRAVFAEPLAAACRAVEQAGAGLGQTALVLGDGKLGTLCAWVLAAFGWQVTLAGHHAAKLARAAWRGVDTVLAPAPLPDGVDLVVEASGKADGISQAARLCRPQGTVILKTTLARPGVVDLAPLVVKEIRLLGSRCGLPQQGLAFLEAHPDLPLERLISASYPLAEAETAFAHAQRPEAMKILVSITEPARDG